MENKIKVLIVGSDSSVKGGITSVIDRFLNYKWDYIDIELLPTYIEGSKLKRILFFLKGVVRYIKRLIKNDFDIVHIHMSYKGSFFRKFIIVKLSKLFNKKTIIHLHGSEFEVFYNKSNKIIKKLIKDILQSCNLVIVLGEMWKGIIEDIAPDSNIRVFNNAVNIPDYTVIWNKDKINVLFLGVLIKRKGIYDLIEAIRLLNEDGIIKEKNINFIIGGTGPEEEGIKNKINEYNLEFCIEMTGWVSGDLKEELFKKSQIFILPSYNEGLPMAILEAMSYGIPVISTNVGSISEAVIDKKTGYLINPYNFIELKDNLIKSIFNENDWTTMSKEARISIINKFSEKRYFEEMEVIYKRMHDNI